MLRSAEAALGPADGLWVARPKKAAKIDGDLDFETAQRIAASHTASSTNKSASIDERWQALRFVPPGGPVKVGARDRTSGAR